MPERVRITEVSPRDGLQNEPGFVPTAEKVRLVEMLCATGVDEVEVTSFVSPKWVPQLGDGEKVFRWLDRSRDEELGMAESENRAPALGLRGHLPVLSVLVPNERGLDAALDVLSDDRFAPFSKISVFGAASETFSRRNINASIAESMERFEPVIERSRAYKFAVRGYLSCAIACPFEGPIDPRVVAMWALVLHRMGAQEIDLGDTIGAATPATTRELLLAMRETMAARIASPTITLHLHDTFGHAAECVKVALDMGVRSFDGSVAGLGGCPYASTPRKRAPGNISTETLVRTIHDAGYETGVDLEALAKAADYAREIVARSRASAAGGPA